MQILDSGYLGVSDSDNGFDISKLNLVGVSKLNLYETHQISLIIIGDSDYKEEAETWIFFGKWVGFNNLHQYVWSP